MFAGRDDAFYELESATRLQRVVVLARAGRDGEDRAGEGVRPVVQDTGGVDQPDWVLWHSFEPGAASFGLDGVITEIGADGLRHRISPAVDHAERRQRVEKLLAHEPAAADLGQLRDGPLDAGPGQATPPLDTAGCAEIRQFLARLAAGGRSAVIITSRTAEDWLGSVSRILVGRLLPEEAAEYAGWLLAAYPAAGSRRARRAFGELLEWLDGHPLSMRLTLPHLARGRAGDAACQPARHRPATRS